MDFEMLIKLEMTLVKKIKLEMTRVISSKYY
jgi:hypothetical protein